MFITLAADFYELMELNLNVVQLLQTLRLLPDDTNPQTCTKCDGVIKMCSRKKSLAFGEVQEYITAMRVQRGWQTLQFFIKKNAFFTFTDLNNDSIQT